MKIPYPENACHVDNLKTISLLEAQGWEGPDVSVSESLYSYHMLWREVEDETIFIHQCSHGKRYDRTSFKSNLDVKREFNWVDWERFYSFTGLTEEEWSEFPLTQKIYDLVGYYGVEEIFGTTYWEGFKISEE